MGDRDGIRWIREGFLMVALIDGYQVFKQTQDGNWLPVSNVYGSFREAVNEKLRLRAIDGGTFQIQSIINKNNSK